MLKPISVPKYRLAQKRFNFYVDDTHSGGRILDSEFKKIRTGQDGLRPILYVSGLLIEENKEAGFFEGFNALRKKYADFLGMHHLPIIHMRQLWGKNPPHDKGRNPFSGVDFDTRFKWTREIVEYLCNARRHGAVGFVSLHINIDEQQVGDVEFYNSELIKRECEILKNKFGGRIRDFYNVILNPLPRSIAESMIDVDHLCKNLDGNVTFFYDYSEGSKGFDALKSYDVARKLGYLKNTRSVIPTNTVTHVGLQCADVVAYVQQRRTYAEYTRQSDAGIDRLMKGLHFPFETAENTLEGLQAVTLAKGVGVMLHFELGVQVFRKSDPEWVEKNMYTPSELLARLNGKQGFLNSAKGINLVRDEMHADWEQQ